MNCPWSTRPIRAKLYGPRDIIVPKAIAAIQPAFIEIDLPAWSRSMAVMAGNTTSSRFAFVPRAELQPDGVIGLNDLGHWIPTFSVNPITSTQTMLEVPVKTITLLNFGTLTAVTWRIFAALSDIEANAMPQITSDRGLWATYNGQTNNPT